VTLLQASRPLWPHRAKRLLLNGLAGDGAS